MNTLIKAERLCKTFGFHENMVKAVDKVNMEIEAGDMIAIMGTSGSGKTTLLNLLSGLDMPTSGRVVYKKAHIDMTSKKELTKYRSKHVGFIFQFFHLLPVLSAQENIHLPLMINGQKADEAYIDSLIDILKIRGHLHTPVTKLSGGQQQRVAIARALAHKPDIVFADEPTGALDTRTSLEIMNLLKDISTKFGQTLIIVTHDPIVADQCKRVISLEDGKIISDIRRDMG